MQKCKAIPPTKQNHSHIVQIQDQFYATNNKYGDHVGENYRGPFINPAQQCWCFPPHDLPFRPFSTSRQDNPKKYASESQDTQKSVDYVPTPRRGFTASPDSSLRLSVHFPRISLEWPV